MKCYVYIYYKTYIFSFILCLADYLLKQKMEAKTMQTRTIVFVLIGLFLMTTVAITDVPHMINYQGALTDDYGIPIEGIKSITFCVHSDSLGMTGAEWCETRSCTLRNGLFNVVLGEGVPIPKNTFDGSVRWMKVTVEGDELTPLRKIVTVPYAFRSANADTADYAFITDDGDWARSLDTLYVIDEHIGIGTSQPWAKFGVARHNRAGVVIRSTTDGDVGVGFKYAGLFNALDEGGGNAGVIARAGCIGLDCNPAIHNVGIWAIYTEGGRTEEPTDIPEGNWAGYFEGKTYFSDNVGIGEDNPTYDLDVADDVRIQDDLLVGGDADVNGDLDVGGMLKLTFDYESPWTSITPGNDHLFTHSLGGNEDKYIVFLEGKNSDGILQMHSGHVSWYQVVGGAKWAGCAWYKLNNSTITVRRGEDDEDALIPASKRWDQVRIRILKNQ
jgi:hypothetical protein